MPALAEPRREITRNAKSLFSYAVFRATVFQESALPFNERGYRERLGRAIPISRFVGTVSGTDQYGLARLERLRRQLHEQPQPEARRRSEQCKNAAEVNAGETFPSARVIQGNIREVIGKFCDSVAGCPPRHPPSKYAEDLTRFDPAFPTPLPPLVPRHRGVGSCDALGGRLSERGARALDNGRPLLGHASRAERRSGWPDARHGW